jgi:hypothetical protein
MAWISLHERLSTLPLVLAGPILRRTERNAVTVWVALKAPRSVTLKILRLSGEVICSGTNTTIAAGTNVHIVAVTAKAPAAALLQPGQNYFYDLDFGNGERLGSPTILGSASGVSTVSYPPAALPSFALPPSNLSNLHVFHGSCRKPHGEGLDAMPALDGIIQKSVADPNARPHQLFLTGDQIYADDVADALLFMLRDAGETLLGWSERLPDVTDTKELEPGHRTPLTRRAGFTTSLSDDDKTAKSHLLTLGEYIAMYLFAWSDVLWPEVLPNYTDIFGAQSGRRKHKGFDEEITRLEDFRRELAGVRRALANVPTYMICDDHEITDDWFINRKWCDFVLSTLLGRRVLQNGLTAVALFQAWGNTPDQFNALPGAHFLQAVVQLSAAGGVDETARRDIAHLIGLPYSDVEALTFRDELRQKGYMAHIGTQPWHGSIAWHYQIAWDLHEVIVLDTRTWREFPSDETGFPSLLSDEAFREQILRPNEPTPQKEITLVVSAGPVVGVPLVEWLQNTDSPKKRLDRDSEAWALERPAFERLFARLSQRSLQSSPDHRFVLLCGDVHYGYTTRLQYWAKQLFEAAAAPARAIFAQLTASSFRNETEGPPFLLFFHIEGTRFLHRSGYKPIIDSIPIIGPLITDHLPETREVLGWANPGKQPKQIGTLHFLDSSFSWTTEAGNPALTFPNDMLMTGTLSLEPEWRYRIDYLVAAFEIDDDFHPQPTPQPDANRSKALQSYLTAAKDYDDYAERWGNGKEIVGVNNFGEITFNWSDSANRSVTHLIWWRLENQAKSGAPLDLFPLTKYIVPLNFDDPAYPMPPLH